MLNLKVIMYLSRPRILDPNLVILRLCCHLSVWTWYGRWNNGWFINLSCSPSLCSPSLISRPQLSCNHLLLLQVSNLEQIRGISGENNGRDMRGTDRWHNLKRTFVLHHAKSKFCRTTCLFEKANGWRGRGIFDNQSKQENLSSFDLFFHCWFLSKDVLLFWPSLFWFFVLYDSNLFEQKE